MKASTSRSSRTTLLVSLIAVGVAALLVGSTVRYPSGAPVETASDAAAIAGNPSPAEDRDADAPPAGSDEDAAAEEAEREAEEREEEVEATNGAAAIAFRHYQQVDEEGRIPNNALVKARDHVKAMRDAASGKTGSSTGTSAQVSGPFNTWDWLGPGNIGGRINAILIHPTTPSTMWIGSATGGIFRSADSGGHWTHLDDFMANLAVSSLVAHPSTPDTIYAGTGEYVSFNVAGSGDVGNRGAGVFVSTDAGDTWDQVATTANSSWWYTNRLAVHPTAATTLLAATSTGVWKTTNAGQTAWTNVLPSVVIMDVAFDPTDGSNAVAGGYAGTAWYSTDTGATWHAATGMPASGRIELAYAASDPTIVYASVNVNGGLVYRSTDGGHSYTLAGPTSGLDLLGNQGNYGNALWVSPTNADRLVVGGVDLYQSTDAGATFNAISDWTVNQNHVITGTGSDSAHADHHAIVANPNYPTDTSVYFGNDGGIFEASNITTVQPSSGWLELNNNLGTTQFYGADGNVASGKIFGGTQDNGTLVYTGGTETWAMTFGGDGGYGAADPDDPAYLYGEYVYGAVHRSSNGGVSGDYISGVTGYGAGGTFLCTKAAQYEIADVCNQTANFIAPFKLDPSNPQRMLVGGLSLWRTNDARTANTASTGPAWTAIKAAVGSTFGAKISAIAIDPNNPDLVYVGHNNGLIYRSVNATALAPLWTRVDLDAMPARIVLSLTIDPANANVVYASFGGFTADNLWRLSDGGTNWTDRTGSGLTGLPDVPTRSVVVDPAGSSRLYVGTEIGVFTSDDSGLTWSVPNAGPANVPVDQLFVMGSKLVAATYGRGIFQTDLLGAGGGGNTAPTISNVTNQTTTTSVAVGPLAVTVGDAQTAAGSLTLTGSSSNQTLVPNANITFGGSGASRTVTVTPAAAQTGSATITLTVSDGSLTAFDTFVLTVSGGGSCIDDVLEPNNTPGTATAITSGQVINAVACDDDDFAITATAGQTLTADLGFVHADGDLDLALLNSAGTLVAASNGTTNAEQIVWPVTVSGTYYVVVYPYDVSVDQNSYTLTVTKTGDTTKPTVTSRFPTPGATGVPRDYVPNATFSELLQPATVTATTFKLRDTTSAVWVPATVSWSASTKRMTLRPTALLAAGHRFTAYITAGVKDLAGNTFAGTSWSFTASTDATKPTIIARRPAPNATGVSRGTYIVVTFSEQMRASTLTTATVRLRDASTLAYVTCTLSYDATLHRVVLNPAPTLAARHKYTVILSSSIRDRAGNRLTSASWSFTTGS